LKVRLRDCVQTTCITDVSEKWSADHGAWILSTKIRFEVRRMMNVTITAFPVATTYSAIYSCTNDRGNRLNHSYLPNYTLSNLKQTFFS
jgi:hypothetical protein